MREGEGVGYGERGERKGETSTPILTMGKKKHIL